MNWIEQNKVASSIMGGAIVVSGVLVFLGMSANSDATAARNKELASIKKIDALQAATPYPSKENEEMLAENLALFAAETKKFQDILLTFRPEELIELSANEFSGEVSTYINKLTSYYKSQKIELPNNGKCFFGMELYERNMAPEDATSYLNYNRQALEWLFMALADSGIDTLHNAHRAPEAETLAKKIGPAARPNARSKAKAPAPIAISSVYDGLPIEITFTGTEASLNKFIADVAAGEEYFFALRYLKVLNEEQDPVVISKATFPPAAAAPAEGATEEGATEEGAEASPFGGVEIGPEGESGFGAEFFGVPEDKEIIKQVIGDEKITVFLMFELVHFKEESSVPIPRLVEEAPKKVSTK